MEIPTLTAPAVGIHISRGVTPRIPIGGLVIGEGADGASANSARLELQLDTCIHWLEIALAHLSVAKVVHEQMLVTKNANDLDKEFKACVQASVAAATFFEALYAAVLERMPTKPVTKGPNRQQRPSRYAIVTEALRQAFGLKKQSTANLRGVLKEVYRFRDEAVHPSAKFSEPVFHKFLGVCVERRFVMFGYSNARQLVRAALALSWTLSSRNLSQKPKPIQEFATYLLTVGEPLYSHWKQSFGELFDPTPNVAQPIA